MGSTDHSSILVFGVLIPGAWVRSTFEPALSQLQLIRLIRLNRKCREVFIESSPRRWRRRSPTGTRRICILYLFAIRGKSELRGLPGSSFEFAVQLLVHSVYLFPSARTGMLRW
jgi:hypothetical protein